MSKGAGRIVDGGGIGQGKFAAVRDEALWVMIRNNGGNPVFMSTVPNKEHLTESDEGEPIAVTTGAYADLHTVPAGFRDTVHLWYVTNNAAAQQVVIRHGGGAASDYFEQIPSRSPVKVIDGLPLEAGKVLAALAVGANGMAFGYVERQPV